VRPQFFGGMLLTEDDLQSITDYVVEKRRLTNRSVFGTGVACGLDVTCDPCDVGSVVVAPGYAIDCCGNDIVVSCPETLDVLALVRDLRDRTGVDCGEPCDDQPCQSYVLNVLYAEEPTDPVAPYDQDDCAVGDCQFSRVREGYRFELSCEAPDPEPNLIDELRKCFGVDDAKVREKAAAMTKVVQLAKAHRAEPLEVAAEAELTIPRREEFDAAEIGPIAVKPAVELLGRTVAALSQDAAAHEGRARSLGLNTVRRDLLSRRSRDLARRILDSEELKMLDESERTMATRILTTAEEQENLAEIGDRGRMLLAQGYTERDAPQIYEREAALIRNDVLRGFVETGRSGCAEYRRVAGLKLDVLDERSYEAASYLARNYLSILTHCLCKHANPPCGTCTDPRVPIARVRVDRCEVIEVCALERHWINSPRNLAYWFPVVELLRQTLYRRCCPDDGCRETPKGIRQFVREREVNLLRDEAAQGMLLVRPLEEVPMLRQLMEALGDQFVDAPRPAFAAAMMTAREPATAATDDRITKLEGQILQLREQLDKLTPGAPA
jgi:hypothetical protein